MNLLNNLTPSTQKSQLEMFNISSITVDGNTCYIKSEAQMSFSWACKIAKEVCTEKDADGFAIVTKINFNTYL